MVAKFIYTSILLSLILTSCSPSKISLNELEGVYLQRDNRRIELHLNNDSFVLKDNFEPTHLAIETYKCCDTITFGKWEIESGFLSLSSPLELNTYYLNMDVIESIESSNDSIIFIINNPIEHYLKKESINSRDLYYSISINTKYNGVVEKKVNTNVFKIEQIKGINSITITIYPSCDMNTRNIASKEFYTLPYKIVNTNTNVFNINIPKLDYGYLTYERLNKDYIKIISSSKLLWNGKEYYKR